MKLSITDIFEKPQVGEKEIFRKHAALTLSFITLLATAIRIYYFSGLAFSDDGYYDQLGYMILKGDNLRNFIGYPIFILRKLDMIFTALSFYIFGTNETASVLPDLLFSIGNIIVIYFISLELSLKKSIALLSAFLLCFFPVDIFFATLHFTDLPASFFINLGVYFLLISLKTDRILPAISSGVLLLLSFFIKESAIFILTLILIIWAYYIIFRKVNLVQIPVIILIFAFGIIAESVYYGITQGEYLFRFTMQNRNYIQCYYNYFPYVKDVNSIELSEYMKRLISFITQNIIRFVFLRRYYLFIPLIAAVQSIFLLKKHKELKLITWFAGLVLLAIIMSTSLTTYRPLELEKSWYAYIFLTPTILLTAIFINRLKPKYKIIVVVLYITGSLLMVYAYSSFFEIDKCNQIKHFARMNNDKIIYADHHSKYNIDLSLGYMNPSKIRIFTGKDFSLDSVKPGELVFLKPSTISVLELEGYKFSDMKELKSNMFKVIFDNQIVQIYEKK